MLAFLNLHRFEKYNMFVFWFVLFISSVLKRIVWIINYSWKLIYRIEIENKWVEVSYSESELDFSFTINSVPDFDSASQSDSSSEFMNLDVCIFFDSILAFF